MGWMIVASRLLPMNALRLLSLCVGAAMLAGCADTKPKVVERGTVSIKVVPPAGKGAQVRVSAYAPKNGARGPEIQMHETGSDGIAGFVLPMGPHYTFRAFADLDHNGKPGPNEPAGELTGVEPDPDVHNTQPPLVLTLSMPAPGSVPAEAPVADKKKGKGAAPDSVPAPASATKTPAPAAGAAAKTQEPGGAGLPVPPPPKP